MQVPKPKIVKMLGKVLFVDFPTYRVSNLYKKAFPGKGRILLVDLDETLLKTNSSIELLAQITNNDFANNMYNHYSNLVKTGKMTLPKAMLEAQKEVVKIGVNKTDYEKTVDRIIKEEKVRKDVLEVCKYLQGIGRKVVLATRSSQETANLFAKRLGFDGAIGSIEKFDEKGMLTGSESLVGNKNTKTIKTKINRLKEWGKANNMSISPKNVSLLSDSYDDVVDARKSGLGVLYIPEKTSSHQDVARKFKLRDYEVWERDPSRVRQLKLALRFPKAALNAPDRVKEFAREKHSRNHFSKGV